MNYPDEVITKDKKGKKEVRLFVERGEYVKYQYVEPETGKVLENGKTSVMLKSKEGKEEHLFIIPMKNGKSLLITKKEGSQGRKLWSNKEKKAVDIF